MSQRGYQMGGRNGIDPNDLAMSGNFQGPYQNHYSGHGNPSNAFSTGSAVLGDDELLEGLGSPTEPQAGLQDYNTMNEMGAGFSPGIYGSHHGLPIDQQPMNGYSSTPDGDPIQSPFVHNFGQYRQLQHPQSFTGSLKSPLSYAGSPLAAADLNGDGDANYLSVQARARMAQNMQRKPSSGRGPLTPKTAAMAGLSVTAEAPFGAQPIRTNSVHHEKSHSGQWIQTPNSLSSFPGSGFSSPLQQPLQGNHINDIILKGGASMPAKLGAPSAAASTQEARRKRRRESHNLVERRRRDNINERIQDLSKLVPAHRLDDEKIRKAIQNGTPLSPTLGGLNTQATSTLAGPGARRAAGGITGNITTGLPVDDKDKGPNKGDILNGAVSWTRDLMWMLHLKIQQQEELVNALYERGGQLPFEITDDERRMQTELMEALTRSDEGTTGLGKTFSYSRTAGSGLRVPHHTDYKGEPLNGNGHGNGVDHVAVTPGEDGAGGLAHDMLDNAEFLDYDDDASADMNFKEEDDYGMDLTN